MAKGNEQERTATIAAGWALVFRIILSIVAIVCATWTIQSEVSTYWKVSMFVLTAWLAVGL